jgi:hypothetical protein
MTVFILPATEKYLNEVVKRCPYANDKKAVKLTREYFNRSAFAWAGLSDDQPVCIYGLIAPSLLNNDAYLWLVVNDLVDKHQFSFVRHSQIEMRKMLILFPRIVGHVLEGEERSKRWLKWLGVRLGRSEKGLIPFELRSA